MILNVLKVISASRKPFVLDQPSYIDYTTSDPDLRLNNTAQYIGQWPAE